MQTRCNHRAHTIAIGLAIPSSYSWAYDRCVRLGADGETARCVCRESGFEKLQSGHRGSLSSHATLPFRFIQCLLINFLLFFYKTLNSPPSPRHRPLRSSSLAATPLYTAHIPILPPQIQSCSPSPPLHTLALGIPLLGSCLERVASVLLYTRIPTTAILISSI